MSWIRRTDFHILTTGVYTYTTDMRFSVLHPEGTDDWTLQIKYAEERDNGTYECQVSESVSIWLGLISIVHLFLLFVSLVLIASLSVQSGVPFSASASLRRFPFSILAGDKGEVHRFELRSEAIHVEFILYPAALLVFNLHTLKVYLSESSHS